MPRDGEGVAGAGGGDEEESPGFAQLAVVARGASSRYLPMTTRFVPTTVRAISASFSRRARATGSSRSSRISFTATGSPACEYAKKTSPIPPEPSSPATVYRPIRTGTPLMNASPTCPRGRTLHAPHTTRNRQTRRPGRPGETRPSLFNRTLPGAPPVALCPLPPRTAALYLASRVAARGPSPLGQAVPKKTVWAQIDPKGRSQRTRGGRSQAPLTRRAQPLWPTPHAGVPRA